MAMFNYGVGGQEVKSDASPGMTDLDQNRTLFVQKLTQEEPVEPTAVYDLKTIDEVFEHFKPNVDVEFQDGDGAPIKETLRFKNLGDFQSKSLQSQSGFLQDLSVQQEQYEKIVKQLKTNKVMRSVMETAEAKAAFINALQSLIQELDGAE
jgi:predicted component of type VI protein secretion system